MRLLRETLVLKCEQSECEMIDCPCVRLEQWRQQEWLERSLKAARNVGDLWEIQRGMKVIADYEIARLDRKCGADSYTTKREER